MQLAIERVSVFADVKKPEFVEGVDTLCHLFTPGLLVFRVAMI
jgi:hypothetical protein